MTKKFSDDEEVLGVGVTREGWLEVVLGGKRLVARSTTSLLGGPTHVNLALVRGNTAVKVNMPSLQFKIVDNRGHLLYLS